MSEPASPLRYPGGKAALADLLGDIIVANNLHDGTYVEPFAGGAGAAVELLRREVISRIIINDYDYPIYAFWSSALRETDRFVDRLMDVKPSISAWESWRAIYLRNDRRRLFETGFATFMLNRCNRSGIIRGGGPIGGQTQKGAYKIDARFNRDGLIQRLRMLQQYADRITVMNVDGMELLRRPPTAMRGAFVYLDPPYVRKGPELYLRGFGWAKHLGLAKRLAKDAPFRWVLTYDNAPEIVRLYRGMPHCFLSLGYSAATRSIGTELMVLDRRLQTNTDLFTAHRNGRKVAVARVMKPVLLTN